MANHPDRSKYRYYYVCPRGFANEVLYIRVRPDEVAAVDAYFDGWIDRRFDEGYTDAMCGWTDGNAAQSQAARIPGAADSWSEYIERYG